MSRVVIVNSKDVQPTALRGSSGVTVEGKVESKPLVTKSDRPLNLWLHTLSAGAALGWDHPPVGHVVFVWKGDVLVDGRPLGREGAVIIEHNGQTVIKAGANGAALAHFQMAEGRKPSRAGGHVHAVPPDGIYQCPTPQRHSNNILWADSSCETCELWLHQSKFGVAGLENIPHYHTEDEIIFVTDGKMIVGNRELEPGTALAIDANTTYGFDIAEGGLAFINFRVEDPSVVLMQRGRPLNEPINERENFKAQGALVKQALVAAAQA